MAIRFFFRVSLVYALAGLGLVLPFYDNLEEFAPNAAGAIAAYASLVKGVSFWFWPIIVVLPFVLRLNELKTRAVAVLFAAVGCVAVQVGFTFIKSSIPNLVPFYADPFLAGLDRGLHGGIDPWVLAHAAVSVQTALKLLPVYLQIWTISAIALPILIALSDDNADRIKRYILMYLFCWIVIGNLLAILFSSVGPVYYDDLLGGDRFGTLKTALADTGITPSLIGIIQRHLWEAYESQSLILGSGISAFPSVHLGIATTTALYMTERSRFLAPVGLLFVAIILFLSVYTGYHYAIDGYFSILAVVVFWAWLRRAARVRASDDLAGSDGLPRSHG